MPRSTRTKRAGSVGRPHNSYERYDASHSRRLLFTCCADVSAGDEGQQRQQALPRIRAMRCGAIVSVFITRCADVSAYEEGLPRRQAFQLLRAIRCSALAPVVISCRAEASACEEGQQPQPALHRLRALRHSAIELAFITSVGLAESVRASPAASLQHGSGQRDESAARPGLAVSVSGDTIGRFMVSVKG